MDVEEVTELSRFEPVRLGGHYAIIKNVTETKTTSGIDMIVVSVDFTSRDEQAGYFSKAYANDTRENKKWPFSGRKCIIVNDFFDSEKASRQFKIFCLCVEKSNDYKIQWDLPDWGKQFIDKKIGVVYGEEEQEFNGETSMRRLPKWFCQYDNVSAQRVPDPKYLKPRQHFVSQKDAVPDGIEEELPF